MIYKSSPHTCFKLSLSTHTLFHKILCIAVISCLSVVTYSQEDNTIDSLNKVLVRAKGKQKFEITLSLMRAYLKNSPEKSLELSYAAEKIGQELRDSLLISKAIFARGFIQTKMDMLNESITELSRALAISKRNNFENEEIKILNALAISYSFSGNYDKSLQYHFQSLQLNEKIDDKQSISISCNNIGFVYFKLRDWENAINFYDRSLQIKKSINSNFDLDRLLINLALCYNQLKRYSEAEKYVKEALEMCGKNCDPQIKMEAELSLGISLLQQKRKNDPKNHFINSLTIARSINDKRFQIENLLNLAIAERQQSNPKDAILFLKEAEAIAVKTNYGQLLIGVYKEFSNIYNEQKSFQNSAIYQAKYIKLKDSLYSADLIKNLAKVQTNFAERENIKTIKEKNEVLVLKDKLLKKQRELSAVIVAITLIVLTFAFILIIFQRKYSKRLKEVNLKLEEKVLERTQDLKKTNEKLERAQGDLRNFLYKTSHDIRGPVATLKGLNNLGFDNINDHVFSKELLEKKSTQIEKMIRTLSRITVVADITNTILQAVEINFVKMMDEIKDFERKNGLLKYIKISIEVEPNLKVVSDPILIRMILENMVDNSLKFFNESKRIEPYVKISIKSVGSDAMIMVEDNGVGIEVKPNQDVFTMFMRGSEKSETGGVGLYLCKICTDRLQGSIKLEKTSKAGTTFSIRISQDATHQVMEINEALMAQLRKEEPPIIEFDQETNN